MILGSIIPLKIVFLVAREINIHFFTARGPISSPECFDLDLYCMILASLGIFSMVVDALQKKIFALSRDINICIFCKLSRLSLPLIIRDSLALGTFKCYFAWKETATRLKRFTGPEHQIRRVFDCRSLLQLIEYVMIFIIMICNSEIFLINIK